MAESSFVGKYTGTPLPETKTAAEEPAWRKAFWVDNSGSGNPFSLSVRYKDDREAEGFASLLYLRHRWLDKGGKVEKLVLLFSVGVIYLEGQYLQQGLDAFEDGRLKRIREQAETEIKLIEAHNLYVREKAKKEPIISRVKVAQSFQEWLESKKAFAEIAKVMKGGA